MRCYLKTTVAEVERIWEEGFRNMHRDFGLEGVFFSTKPLDTNDGFDGDVIICLDVPDELFNLHDVTDEIQQASGYRLSLIPAKDLRQLGQPKIYDHNYAGCSRRDLLRSVRRLDDDADVRGQAVENEAWKKEEEQMQKSLRIAETERRHAEEMRGAIEFFDRIGWLTPLRLQEQHP